MQFEGIFVFGFCLLLGRLKFGALTSWTHAFAAYGGSCVAYAGTFWAAANFTTTGLRGLEVIDLGDKLITEYMDPMSQEEFDDYEKRME